MSHFSVLHFHSSASLCYIFISCIFMLCFFSVPIYPSLFRTCITNPSPKLILSLLLSLKFCISGRKFTDNKKIFRRQFSDGLKFRGHAPLSAPQPPTRRDCPHAPESAGNWSAALTSDVDERMARVSTPYCVPSGNASVGYLPTNSNGCTPVVPIDTQTTGRTIGHHCKQFIKHPASRWLRSFYARKQLLLSAFHRVLAIAILSVRLSHGWISQKRCKLESPNLHRRLLGRL